MAANHWNASRIIDTLIQEPQPIKLTAKAPSASTASARHRNVVLVVNGEAEVDIAVAQSLRELGVRVKHVSTGAAACERLFAGGIDLVILDIALPDARGIDICERIRRDPRSTMVPVIMTMGPNASADRAAALRVGASEFLAKPVNREELLVRARTLLELRATRRALDQARARERRRQTDTLRSSFKRYLPPVVADPDVTAGGSPSERCADAMVLFADLRGFTRLSELLDPADLLKLLNEFFERMTRIVQRAGGTVFHFAGDALMAGFGVPATQPDAASRAVGCGLRMIAQSRSLFERWPATVGLGIGINRGEVIAGNVGSNDYMSYTLIGDVVNVASRLTTRARAGEVLMSKSVLASIHQWGETLDAVALPPISIRGKEQPIEAYCLTVFKRPEAGAAERQEPQP